MKYFQLTISSKNPGKVTEILSSMEIYSYSISDPADVVDIIENKKKYKCDYVSEELSDLAKGEVADVTIYFESEEEAVKIKDVFPDCERSLIEVDDESWKYVYKEHFRPHMISDNIKVTPTWEEGESSADTIVLDPGMAFGTGSHETTGMCANLMSEMSLEGKSFLDVGTGSGILAIVAKKMGAGYVLGIDIDNDATIVASENIRLNGMEKNIEIKQGNLVDGIDFKADIVCANLVAELVCELAQAVRPHLLKGGTFISSGILEEKEDMERKELLRQGFIIDKVIRKNQWVAIKALMP